MARDVVIPDAVFPPAGDPSGQLPPAPMNDAAKSQRAIQITAAGRDSYIPVIYGGPERTAGLLYLARVYNSKLVLCILLCEGPVEQIANVEMNDAAVPAGVTVTTYDGSQVAVDATLAAAIPGFAEAMTGTAYAVCQIPAGASQGFPRFTFEVRGRKVYDPRGAALDFELANTTGVEIPDSALWDFGAVDFALEAWVRFESLTTLNTIFEHGRYTAGFLARHSTATMQLYVNGSGAGQFATWAWAPTLATWYHIIVQRRGTDAEFYVNGAAVTRSLNLSAPATAITVNATPTSAIGKSLHTTGQHFDGMIRGVRLYSGRSFSAAEAADRYANSFDNASGQVGHWPLSDGSGTSAADLSGNGNNGTLTGAVLPAWVTPAAAWSDNPALILADYLTNQDFGARKTATIRFWQSVAAAADHDDAMIGSPPEKRALLTFTIAERRAVKEWIDVLRAYVPCWVLDDGAEVALVVDRPRTTDHVFTATAIAAKPAPRLTKRGVRDTPTVVEIGYTRTDVKPWAAGYAEATTGAGVRRKARIEMPGIRRYSQARRFAIERLNHYTLEDLQIAFGVFESGLKVREGDVVEVTDDLGPSAKKFRVLRATDRGHGRWLVNGREYDPAAFSSVVETTPSSPNTGLPDPRAVPAPTALSITETVYLEKNLSADSLARGLIYQSRFDVSWTASTYAYPCAYRVQFLDGAQVVHEGTTPGTTYSSPAVQQGKTYSVKVFTRAGLGFESSALQDTKTAQGKLLAPGNVPAITSALEIGGEVLLQWTPAVDIDVVRYEWRYGPVSGFSWATATLIDRVDGLRARFRGLPTGAWRFAVKAIDSVGNYSATETTVDITVTSDADAFLQDREFVSPTLTNMIELPPLEGVWRKRWATAVAADQWNTVIPNPVNSGSNPVFTYHASASARWQGESWDFGAQVTGDWSIVADVTVLSGSAIYEIEHSLDGSAWTAEAGTSWKGAARFVRPVIRSTTTSTLLLNSPPKVTLAAVTRREATPAGTVETSLASGAKTISLAGKYIKAVAINITIRGTAARMATVDNVVLSLSGANSFDVYIFDAAGVQQATDFTWDFEGF